MPLLPVKKQKTPACIREIQVYKLWTKVYSQKGLTAMVIVRALGQDEGRRGMSVFFLLHKTPHLTCAYYDKMLKVQFLLVDHCTEWGLLHFDFFLALALLVMNQII